MQDRDSEPRYKVRLYGDPVLRRKAAAVTEFDDELRQLAADMFETMDAEHGAGLAAPQIGVLRRVYVFNEYGEPDEDGDVERIGRHVFVNPEIVNREGSQHTLEGCLSIPGLRFDGVPRAETVTIRYFDLDGNEHTMSGSGYLAQTVQHEQDHLDGILYLDRLSQAERTAFMDEHRKELARMQKTARARLKKE